MRNESQPVHAAKRVQMAAIERVGRLANWVFRLFDLQAVLDLANTCDPRFPSRFPAPRAGPPHPAHPPRLVRAS